MPETYHPEAYAKHGFNNLGDEPTNLVEVNRIIKEGCSFGLVPRIEQFRVSGGGFSADVSFRHPLVPSWYFARRWVYWSAWVPDYRFEIPVETATALWDSHGGALRVDGDCGSPKPTKGVSSYHIDTPEALNALIQCLSDQSIKNGWL